MASRIESPLRTIGVGRVLLSYRATTDSSGDPTAATDATGQAATIARISRGLYRLWLGKSATDLDRYRGCVDWFGHVVKSTGQNLTVQACRVNSSGTIAYSSMASATANAIKAATATVARKETWGASDLLTAGLSELYNYPRNVTFTTAGGTAADAPATVTVTGTDVNDAAQTETITLAQTATIASGTKAFKTVSRVEFPAADGTGATIAMGYGTVTAATLGQTIKPYVDFLVCGPDMHWQEWTNPAALDADGLITGGTSAAALTELTTTDFIDAGEAKILATPRVISITVGAGGTPTDMHPDAYLVGTDIDGNVITDTIGALETGGGGTYYSSKVFRTLERILLTAGAGTGASYTIGFTDELGLDKPIKSRAGVAAAVACIDTAVVAAPNGTIVAAATDPPYGSWDPNTALDGSADFALFYEVSDPKENLISGELCLQAVLRNSSVGA